MKNFDRFKEKIKKDLLKKEQSKGKKNYKDSKIKKVKKIKLILDNANKNLLSNGNLTLDR